MEFALKAALDWWDVAGVDVPELKAVPRNAQKAKALPPRKTGKAATPPPIIKKAEPPKPTPDSARIAKAAKTLDDLRLAIADFDAGPLSDGARQSVFSRGNPAADIMVVGEAPGRAEDQSGKPFIGPAGQLLDKMLASIGLSEDTTYITNVVNWRPPQDRNPKPEEIALCLPFIHRHIELIGPKFILIVGGVSLAALTHETGIMKNRGQWKELTIGETKFPALPIYHPAFLLRQPALKRDAWRDLLALKARMEIAEG